MMRLVDIIGEIGCMDFQFYMLSSLIFYIISITCNNFELLPQKSVLNACFDIFAKYFALLYGGFTLWL
ncbi:MAG: hypothetical protein QW717_06605 [Candidatus Bathyarchaeia archaeon]